MRTSGSAVEQPNPSMHQFSFHDGFALCGPFDQQQVLSLIQSQKIQAGTMLFVDDRPAVEASSLFPHAFSSQPVADPALSPIAPSAMTGLPMASGGSPVRRSPTPLLPGLPNKTRRAKSSRRAKSRRQGQNNKKPSAGRYCYLLVAGLVALKMAVYSFLFMLVIIYVVVLEKGQLINATSVMFSLFLVAVASVPSGYLTLRAIQMWKEAGEIGRKLRAERRSGRRR